MKKNTSGQKLTIFAFADAGHATLDAGEPVTGDASNITGKLSLDDAAVAAITDTNPIEIEDGYYVFDLTQAETNADKILTLPQSSTGGVQVIGLPMVIYTTDSSDLDSVKSVTDKLDTGLEADGSSGYQFTALALENGPSGSVTVNSPDTIQSTTIATLSSQTEFTLTSGSGDDDVYNGAMIIVTDQSSSVQKSIGKVIDYVGSTKTITLESALGFTIATGDDVDIIAVPSQIESTNSVTDKLDTALEADGSSGYQFTALALENVPTEEKPGLLQSTDIATLASQTSFTLTAGSGDDDAYNGAMILITDQSTSTQKAVGKITDYAGSTKTVTLSNALEFTIATGDTVDIIAAPKQLDDINSADLTAVKSVTDKIDTGLEDDGSSGYQFTTLALENGPSESSVVVPKFSLSVTSSAGSTADIRVWMEDKNGNDVDISGYTTKTASITLTEVVSDVDLFTQAFVAGDIAKNAFVKQKASPGFTADRQYVAQLTVTLDGTDYTKNDVQVIFG